MKKPLVSICIHTHNRLDFFKEALASALNQTYQNTEIVVSDNSDNTDTEQYINTLNNKKIIYKRDPAKSSSFQNAHHAMSMSKGEFIKNLADDDLLAPTCVEKMVRAFESNPTAGLVMAPLKIIDENGTLIKPKFYFIREMAHLYRYQNHSSLINKTKIMEAFLTKEYPCCVPAGIMFRRSLYSKSKTPDERFGYIGDVDICMQFAEKMDFYYIDEFLAYWRFTPSSETVKVLHKKGIEADIFYKLTKKYLSYTNAPQKAYLFASKRTVINIIAGLRSGNLPLIIETIKTILYNDPYILNKLYLPFDILFEVLKSFIPYEKKR